MALLVSNNFAEIKSNVFKRFSKDNVHGIVYSDSVERFHISAFLLFVLAQNLLEAEGAWFGNFFSNALLVFICEMSIDVIKHSFIAKFNDIKPIAYSEFLEDLCKQTLNIQTDGGKKSLTFVPLAPACVVIRVLTPVYAAHLPCSPLSWRWLWTVILAVLTFVMLASLKVMIGMGLQKHASWYIKRCQRRKLHSD
ncbi:Protein POLLEN DEFTIVE IN GUIDANCE 1 [Dionaea muscipula]